jgi:Fe-S-cluster containining protein
MSAAARQMALRRPTPVRFSLSVLGKPVEVEAQAPPERARLDELLPLLRTLDDAVVDRAIEAVEAKGERISCSKGCGACCKKQPVPVAPPEAAALARLVDRLPEPRRSTVRAAFARAVERVIEAGLYDAYMDEAALDDEDQLRAWAERYLELEIECPFLVDDACGIYQERPFICRQFLVTSPPELCDDPLANPVRPVPVPIRPLRAMVAATGALTGERERVVPLVLALDHAARRRGELGRKHDARAVLGDVLRRIGG